MNNRPSIKPPSDAAKSRFFVIQLVRWSGLAIFMVGLLIAVGKIDLPVIIGYVLIAIGLIDALIMPTMLARRWKTPR